MSQIYRPNHPMANENGMIEREFDRPLSHGYYGVMPDIQPFVTQDKKLITSRSSLRAYEHANGVKQVGNDFATQHRELRQKVRGVD